MDGLQKQVRSSGPQRPKRVSPSACFAVMAHITNLPGLYVVPFFCLPPAVDA